MVRTPAMPLPIITSRVFFIARLLPWPQAALPCGAASLRGAAAAPGPAARPARLEQAQRGEHRQRQHGEGDEAPQVGAGELLRLAHRVGQEAAAERADLADHRAGHRRGERPAQRHELEQRAVARAQGGEAEHEEQRGEGERVAGQAAHHERGRDEQQHAA